VNEEALTHWGLSRQKQTNKFSMFVAVQLFANLALVLSPATQLLPIAANENLTNLVGLQWHDFHIKIR